MSAAQPAAKIPDAASTVVVGCKLPHGLHLDVRRRDGELVRHTIKGKKSARLVGGFGITENVPAEHWAEWFKKNHKHPAVLNGSIFIHTDLSSAKDVAKERAGTKTGLEAIDPTKSSVMMDANDEVDKQALKDYKARVAENPVQQEME